MTDENTPTDVPTAAGEESAAPRRTRSRRVATSGVTTPRSAAATEAAAPSVEPATEPAAEAPAAAPRTRARRGASKAAAAQAAAEASAPAGASAAGPAAAEVPAEAAGREPAAAEASGPDQPAPARARRSRRATSGGQRAAATTPAAEADVPPAADDAGDGGETPAEAPATRPARRRRPAGTAAATPDTQEPAEPAAAAEEAVASAAAGLDVFAAFGAERPTSPEPKVEAPRLPSTALVFQAPDPESRPRRRRAQAPAGPPRHEEPGSAQAPVTPGAEEELEEDVTEGEVAAEATSIETAETSADVEATLREDEDAEEREGGQRRRRRRGGRGRRSRSGGERADVEETEGAPADEAETEEAEPAHAEPSRRSRSRRRAQEAEPETDEGELDTEAEGDAEGEDEETESSGSSRRRRRRRRGSRGESSAEDAGAPAAGAPRSRSRAGRTASDEVTALKGSTRLEAKRQRRREGRDAGRRRTIVTESEFLARRESVERSMIVREANDRVQIAVLEDGVLVEHFVSRSAQNGQSSMAGNVYLGRVQNVLPSMEAAFVDVGKGRNAVLYAGEVNWDAAGMEGQPRRIEQALKSGDSVLVQVTKDPIGHKGARLTSQITLAGRYLVYVPSGGMTGISRKLPENERARLKKLLKEIVPDAAGVIVRTAAEGASEDELRRDVQRLQDQWAAIERKAKSASAPALLQGEPDLAIRVVRDIFNDDFSSLVVQGDGAWSMIHDYVDAMAPDLAAKVSRWTEGGDVFAAHRIDEQLAKGMERKVWLPSGGSLVIDRTEAMTVVDVNTGKFTGSGGTLEETVTRNNLEAAEEIVRQLRLRDIGGIIVIDFIDMVLESNRDLVLRRLVECLGRDRTKHQVAEVTSLGLVQMTRKRVGQGLVEAFSETCQHCNGRGFIVHEQPVDARQQAEPDAPRPGGAEPGEPKRSRRKKNGGAAASAAPVSVPVLPEAREAVKATLATIAAAAAHAHEHGAEHDEAPAPEAPTVEAQTAEQPSGGAEEPPVAEQPTGTAQPEAHAEPEHGVAAAADESAPSAEPVQDAAAAELADTLGSIGAVEAPVAPVAGPDEEAPEPTADEQDAQAPEPTADEQDATAAH